MSAKMMTIECAARMVALAIELSVSMIRPPTARVAPATIDMIMPAARKFCVILAEKITRCGSTSSVVPCGVIRIMFETIITSCCTTTARRMLAVSLTVVRPCGSSICVVLMLVPLIADRISACRGNTAPRQVATLGAGLNRDSDVATWSAHRWSIKYPGHAPEPAGSQI